MANEENGTGEGLGGRPLKKRGGGRPTAYPGQVKSERIEMRTTPAIKAKVARNGGVRWIERLILEAPEEVDGG